MCEILMKHNKVSRNLLKLKESDFFGGVQEKSLIQFCNTNP